jgi:hypothetical protein
MEESDQPNLCNRSIARRSGGTIAIRLAIAIALTVKRSQSLEISAPKNETTSNDAPRSDSIEAMIKDAMHIRTAMIVPIVNG